MHWPFVTTASPRECRGHCFVSAVPHSNHHIVGTSGWQNHDSSPPAVCYYTALPWLPMSSIGAGLAPMTSRHQIQDGGPTTSDPRWRPPRCEIQDGGPMKSDTRWRSL